MGLAAQIARIRTDPAAFARGVARLMFGLSAALSALSLDKATIQAVGGALPGEWFSETVDA